MIKHIALLTSCIIPNTNSGPITDISTNERLNQLAKNINYLSEHKLLKAIYIIDPFLINKSRKIEFENKLFANGLKNNLTIKLILFKPSKKIQKEIKYRGKGYSELQMIIEGNKVIKKKHKNIIIHKISGRYKILNLKKLLETSLILLEKNCHFLIPYSKLLSKCLTIFYSYKSDIDEKIFDNCLSSINDSNYIYVEHSMYKNLVKRKLVVRNKNIPRLEFNMIGGSNQGKYGRLKQMINKVLYGYF